MKVAPAPLEPLFADASRRPVGILRFNRNGTGRITGFVLDGGRVRHLKFWKETVPARATE